MVQLICFARWSTRDSKPKHIIASKIIDTIVTNNVKLLLSSISYQNCKAKSLHLFMSQIHLYLDFHLDILIKKFIFSTQNETQEHWWRWVAVNPWYHLQKILQQQEQLRDSKENQLNGASTNMLVVSLFVMVMWKVEGSKIHSVLYGSSTLLLHIKT